MKKAAGLAALATVSLSGKEKEEYVADLVSVQDQMDELARGVFLFESYGQGFFHRSMVASFADDPFYDLPEGLTFRLFDYLNLSDKIQHLKVTHKGNLLVSYYAEPYKCVHVVNWLGSYRWNQDGDFTEAGKEILKKL